MTPPTTPPPSVEDLRSSDRLTAPQRRFLHHFADTGLQRKLYLAGGAALAAGYLGHREVDDLDLFGPEPVPIRRLVPAMKALPGLASLQWLLPRDRTTFLITWDDGSQVKVEYRQFPFELVASPWPVGPYYVASLADLLADKIAALTERHYALDRLDILLVLDHLPSLSFDLGVRLAETKFDLEGQLAGTAYERMSAPLDEAISERLHEPSKAATLVSLWLASGGPADSG
ncbi:MAG: hypothetical protein QF464_19040 [Myxococcota bacterium]|nr:hypothetical protein [Myxococcota bacterium]